MMHRFFGPLLSAAIALSATAVLAEPRHGMSTFGDLKYPPGFDHFDYVNPDAPKGGVLRLAGGEGTFDTVNPFTLKGIRYRGRTGSVMSLPYETLMAGGADEPDALYGLVAETADLAPDRTSVTFKLRPEARWHDGTPITVEDVVFSFNTLTTDPGAFPSYRIILRDVTGVEAISDDEVRYTFDPDAVALRDLPNTVATLPILSKAHFTDREFGETTFDPPLGSGPYRIAEVNAGRSIVLERVPDYWAANLGLNRGRFNFDQIRLEFYRDRDVQHEAFKSGEFDFHEEFTSRIWATGYDFPAVRDGRVIKEAVPNGGPASRQYFVLNLRRAKFQDRRVRQAINHTFDFEWTNTNLFYSVYERSGSIYQNTEMAAIAPPDDAELALLKPFEDQVPPEVFGPAYRQPQSDGSGNNRRNLRRAQKLLAEAGWTVQNGQLKNGAGEVMSIEFLTFSPSFERVFAPIVQNMKRIGINASIRIVDSSQYTQRVDQDRDFDITTAAFGVSATPGVGERGFWNSAFADQPGSNNDAGVKDPVVDALVEHLASAKDRKSLTVAARALDRVLLWNQYIIPQWYRSTYTIAYWDMFGRPETVPTYSLGFLDTWWIDPAKAARLNRDKP
ncbi:MAG: extracellular solute-binding protein [Alphaproteobacteria bacterium]